MMGKTHRASGALIALGGYLAFKKYGMLDPHINDLTELVVLYSASYYGSVFPDNDHVWESSPLKDPFSWVINKVLHLTTATRKKMEASKLNKNVAYKMLGLFDARHRSWQTHSEIPLLLIILGLLALGRGFEWTLLLGFGLGYLSHALMDMLSSGGYMIVTFKLLNKVLRNRVFPEKIRLVPRTEFFNTGGKFEEGVYKVINFCTILMAIGIIALECYNIYVKFI